MSVNGVNNSYSNAGLYARGTAFAGTKATDSINETKKDLKKDEFQTQTSTQKSKVAAGLGATLLASVVLGGIYYLTKGKKGNPVPKLGFEKVFNDGTKVTREITDGKTIMKVFDKDGNLLKTKTKEIARGTNPQNGNKYITIKSKTHTIDGDNITEFETNKYYSKDGDKILETIVGKDINSSKIVTSYKARESKDAVSFVKLDSNGKVCGKKHKAQKCNNTQQA